MPVSRDSVMQEPSPGWLTGQFLIAMPTMADPRFARSVIYVCVHNASTAMGLVINRLYPGINLRALLKQVDVRLAEGAADLRVHVGGPVEVQRGFVLHSTDYVRDSTLIIDDNVALTATVEILRDLADGLGPQHAFLALGYAGWSAGQIDAEIQANGWLTVPADESILFDDDLDSKWDRAIAKLGVSPAMLSTEAGHA